MDGHQRKPTAFLASGVRGDRSCWHAAACAQQKPSLPHCLPSLPPPSPTGWPCPHWAPESTCAWSCCPRWRTCPSAPSPPHTLHLLRFLGHHTRGAGHVRGAGTSTPQRDHPPTPRAPSSMSEMPFRTMAVASPVPGLPGTLVHASVTSTAGSCWHKLLHN